MPNYIEESNYMKDPRVVAGAIQGPYKVRGRLHGLAIVVFDDSFIDGWILESKACDIAFDHLSKDEYNALSPEENEELVDKAGTRLLEEFGIEVYTKEALGIGTEEETVYAILANYSNVVCDTCQGEGKVVDPSIDCCGISQEEFNEDPDFAEDYFSGRYDITCPGCGGGKVIAVPQLPDKLNDLIESYTNDAYDMYAEEAAERRMGC